MVMINTPIRAPRQNIVPEEEELHSGMAKIMFECSEEEEQPSSSSNDSLEDDEEEESSTPARGEGFEPVEEGNEVRENHHESASKSEPQN